MPSSTSPSPRRCTARHPADDEGVLSARRAAIVSTPGLARLADRLDLGAYLLLGEGEAQRGGRVRPSLLASAFEALVGALYLDLGLRRRPATGSTAGRRRSSPPTRRSTTLKSPKSRLQEHTQRTTGERPLYRLVEAVGPDHEKQFRIEVEVDGEVLGVGEGPSRRIAETRGRRRRRSRRGSRAARRRRGPTGPRPDAPTAGGDADRMSAPARACRGAARCQGFKSFAERTLVEFGPGISAVVGPNGSGKSNLADALRWALGEQGRALRIAQVRGRHLGRLGEARGPGHGRRHARARQRRRPAAGRLPASSSSAGASTARARTTTSSTASGSGCATSSTCSTPRTSPTTRSCSSARAWSTRRSRCAPRSAGRCSRRSPASAGTSAGGARPRSSWSRPRANLARVEDILAELRPQARRLGQPRPSSRRPRLDRGRGAGRRAARRRACPLARGGDPGRATPSAAATRCAPKAAWRSRRSNAPSPRSLRSRRRCAARADARGASGATSTRPPARERTALGLREARAIGELEATRARPRADRPRTCRGGGRSRGPPARARATRPGAGPRARGGARRRRPGARRGAWPSSARCAPRAGPGARSWRPCGAPRRHAPAEAETARRRLATRRARRAGTRSGGRRRRRAGRRARGRARAGRAARSTRRTRPEERAAIDAREAAGWPRTPPTGRRRPRANGPRPRQRARPQRSAPVSRALEARLADEEARGIARAARARRRPALDEDLAVDPALRAAVEAALGEAARAYVVEQAAVGGLGGERGQLAVRERIDAADRAPGGGSAGRHPPARGRATAAGGGRLRTRFGATSTARRGRSSSVRVWAPDLDAAVRLQPLLPLGWLVVTRDGGAVLDAVLGPDGTRRLTAERRAEGERLAREARRSSERGRPGPARPRHRGGCGRRGASGPRWRPGGRVDRIVRAATRRGRGAHRRSRARGGAREAAWQRAQAEQSRDRAANASAPRLAALEAPRPGIRRPEAARRPAANPTPSPPGRPAWAELRTRRDRLAAEAVDPGSRAPRRRGRRAGAEAAGRWPSAASRRRRRHGRARRPRAGAPPTSGPRSPARSPRRTPRRHARARPSRRCWPTIESSGAGSPTPSGRRRRRASGCA